MVENYVHYTFSIEITHIYPYLAAMFIASIESIVFNDFFDQKINFRILPQLIFNGPLLVQNLETNIFMGKEKILD